MCGDHGCMILAQIAIYKLFGRIIISTCAGCGLNTICHYNDRVLFLSQVIFLTENSRDLIESEALRVERPGSRFLPCPPDKQKHRSARQKRVAHTTQVACFYLESCNLCGLCIGQALSLHLSGIVFVPSIMSFPHMGHISPVGFAFIACLQSG